jgi:predicted metal-dependent TIM-barrel fold hydrolase
MIKIADKIEKILVDLNVEAIEKTLELEMWAGLSVYPPSMNKSHLCQ